MSIDYLEREKAELWKCGTNNRKMPVRDLVMLAIQGFDRCEEDCSKDSCKCIRSAFASPSHYRLYEDLRDLIMRLRLIKAIRKCQVIKEEK